MKQDKSLTTMSNKETVKVLQWISDRQPPMSGVSYYCICLNLLTNKEEKRTIYSTKTGWEYPDSFKVLSWLEEKEVTPIESAEGIPNIKDYFPDATLIDMHNLYCQNPHLWAYIQAMESYINKPAKESVLTDEKVNHVLAELKEVELSLPDTEGINKTLLKSIGYSFKLLFQIQKLSTPTVLSEEQLQAEAEKLYPNNDSWSDKDLANVESKKQRATHIAARKMSYPIDQARHYAALGWDAAIEYTLNMEEEFPNKQTPNKQEFINQLK